MRKAQRKPPPRRKKHSRSAHHPVKETPAGKQVEKIATALTAPVDPDECIPAKSKNLVTTFRNIFREWLTSPEIIAHIQKRALDYEQTGLLTTIIHKCVATPVARHVDDEPRPIVLVFGGNGATPLNLEYKPMGQVPGMGSVATEQGNGQ